MVDTYAGGRLAAPATVPARRSWRAGTRSWWLPLVIFALTRLADGLLLAWLGEDQRAQGVDSGNFVTEPVPASPGYLTLLTNWDGQWYREVAENGYPAELPRIDGEVDQNAWAFYPLYPMAVRALMALTGLPFAVAATTVSLLAGAAGVVLLFRMVERAGGTFNASITVLALCLCPAALAFQAAYTESLCLLLLVAALWSLRERRYALVAATAVLLALTRPVVLPLALVIAVHGLLRWRARHRSDFPVRERWACAGAVAVTGLSFALWPLTSAVVTGEPDAYLLTYGAWVDANADSWTSWLGQLTSLDGLLVGGIGLAALAALVFVVTRQRASAWGVELRLWSVAYALYLLASTVPGASFVRHTMFAIVPWWPAPEPPEHPFTRRQRVLVLVGVAAFGLALQVLWINRFWVMQENAIGIP